MNRYLTKLVIFTIIASTLPIILLGLLFFFQVSDIVQNKVNEGNVQIMEKTRLQIEQVLLSIDRQVEQLAESHIVYEAINIDIEPTRFQLVQSLLSSMSQLQTFDVRVKDIHLVNLNNGWILNNSGFNRLATLEQSGHISRYLDMSRTKFWIYEEQGFSKYHDKKDTSVINLVRKIPAYSEDPQAMLIVEMPSQELRNFIAEDNVLGEVIILDESFRVLSTLNPSTSFPPSMLEALQSFMNDSQQTSGLYEFSTGRSRVGVTFQRSSFNEWVYLSVIPMEVIRLESRNIGWLLAALCLSMLLLAVLISWKGSQHMYAPVQHLYQSLFSNHQPLKKVDEFYMINKGFLKMRQEQVEMAEQIKGQLQQLKELYTLKLIQGEIAEGEMEEKLELLGHPVAKWNKMAVMTIQIDSLHGTRYSERDYELLLFAISNMARELIPAELRLPPIVVGSSVVIAILVNLHSREDFRTFIFSTTKKVQEEVNRYLSLRISIGISRPYDTIQNVAKAYREALDALKYRIWFGHRTVLHIDDLQATSSTATAIYPKEWEHAIIDAVKMADRGQMNALLDQFFTEMSAQYDNYREYQISVTRFFVNLVRILQDSGVSCPELLEEDPPLLEQLYTLTTVDEVRNWFQHKVIEPITQVYEEHRQTKYRSISEEVIELIHERYDTDLNLETCSTLLNYHPSYISKVLRQELGVSFSDYLMQYRLKKAKEMLEQTDMKINEIAKKLCYNNSQNFIRFFRKFCGMTPGAYREHHIRSQIRGRMIELPHLDEH